MSLDPASFYSYTLRELLIASKKKQELMEQEQKDNWERTRWLGMVILQPNLKKGQRLKPTDLITFPWERPKSTKKKENISPRELKKRILERDGKTQ